MFAMFKKKNYKIEPSYEEQSAMNTFEVDLTDLERDLSLAHTTLFGPNIDSLIVDEQNEIKALEEVEKTLELEIKRLSNELENTRLAIVARQAKWNVLTSRMPAEDIGFSVKELREMYFSGQTLPDGFTVEETAQAIASGDELDSMLGESKTQDSDLENLDKPDNAESATHQFYADDLNKSGAS